MPCATGGAETSVVPEEVEENIMNHILDKIVGWRVK